MCDRAGVGVLLSFHLQSVAGLRRSSPSHPDPNSGPPGRFTSRTFRDGKVVPAWKSLLNGHETYKKPRLPAFWLWMHCQAQAMGEIMRNYINPPWPSMTPLTIFLRVRLRTIKSQKSSWCIYYILSIYIYYNIVLHGHNMSHIC